MDRIKGFLLLLSVTIVWGCANGKYFRALDDFDARATVESKLLGEERVQTSAAGGTVEQAVGDARIKPVAHSQDATTNEITSVAQALTPLRTDESPLDGSNRIPTTLNRSMVNECLPPTAWSESTSSVLIDPRQSDQVTSVLPSEENSDEPDESRRSPTPTENIAVQPTEAFAETNTQPIDFRNALAIAVGKNPQVAFAAARIREAYALHTGARSMWLPNFSMGASFYSHNGQLQNAVGNVFDIDRGALYAGLGTRATGTSTPKIPGLATQFALTDAIYQPVITRQHYNARMHEAAATTNDILLSTSLAYLELLNAHQLNSISEETRERAADLASLTKSFARAGQGPQSDADRAATELTARCYKVARSIEATEVASARLAQQLSLELGVQLIPIETELIPVHLVTESESLPALLATGLRSRKELASSKNLVEAACARLHKERAAPLLPRFGFSASYGGFGGGQNSDYGGNFGERIDFESYAYWQLRNLGFGERAARHAAGAKLDQARAKQVQLMDRIAREISEAHARTRSRSRCIGITRKGIESAEHAFERDVKRIRHGEGLPIEALTSLRALDEARRDYANAIFEHNQAQFELLRAIGWPGGKNAVDLQDIGEAQ